MGPLARQARTLHLLVLAVWLGAAAMHLVLWTRLPAVLAGFEAVAAVAVAARRLLDGLGSLGGPVALLALFAGWLPLGTRLRWRALLGLLLTGCAIFSRSQVTPRLEVLVAAPAGAEGAELAELLTLAWQLSLTEIGLSALLFVLALGATGERPQRGIQL